MFFKKIDERIKVLFLIILLLFIFIKPLFFNGLYKILRPECPKMSFNETYFKKRFNFRFHAGTKIARFLRQNRAIM